MIGYIMKMIWMAFSSSSTHLIGILSQPLLFLLLPFQRVLHTLLCSFQWLFWYIQIKCERVGNHFVGELKDRSKSAYHIHITCTNHMYKVTSKQSCNMHIWTEKEDCEDVLLPDNPFRNSRSLDRLDISSTVQPTIEAFHILHIYPYQFVFVPRYEQLLPGSYML